MSDPEYSAQPKQRPEPWHCYRCGGIVDGYVGLEGEWPCQCEFSPAEMTKDDYVDKYAEAKGK